MTVYLAISLNSCGARAPQQGLGRQLLAEAIQRCRVGRMTLIADTAEGGRPVVVDAIRWSRPV